MANFAETEITIKRDKIYTSYFAKATKIIPDRRLVSISLTSPEGWKGRYFRQLNPSVSLLSNYKSGNINTEEYREIYRTEVLSQLNPSEVYNELKGCVLCCWEKSGQFCHRHLIIDWLRENMGDAIIGGEI